TFGAGPGGVFGPVSGEGGTDAPGVRRIDPYRLERVGSSKDHREILAQLQTTSDRLLGPGKSSSIRGLFKPSTETVRGLKRAGIEAFPLVEHDLNGGAPLFHAAISSAKKAATFGAAVEVKSVDRSLRWLAGSFGRGVQVHIRGDVDRGTKAGHIYPDRSFNTPVLKFSLDRPLSQKDTQKIIDKFGLPGLTIGPESFEVYYAEDPRDRGKLDKFRESIKRLQSSQGNVREAVRGTHRLWMYGQGDGAIPYEEVEGELRTGSTKQNPSARRPGLAGLG
ncbi:MAG: hypothetical protein WCL32_23980, partial [Planctomycetota bacterium]